MTTQQKLIKNKLGLLRLAERLGSVSQACAGSWAIPATVFTALSNCMTPEENPPYKS